MRELPRRCIELVAAGARANGRRIARWIVFASVVAIVGIAARTRFEPELASFQFLAVIVAIDDDERSLADRIHELPPVVGSDRARPFGSPELTVLVAKSRDDSDTDGEFIGVSGLLERIDPSEWRSEVERWKSAFAERGFVTRELTFRTR